MAEDSVELLPTELSLFSSPPHNTAIDKVQWVEYRPTSQLGQGAPLEFLIPSAGSQYVDMSRTYLHVKLRITTHNGTSLDAKDVVAPINLTLHSIFSQIDVLLQQKLVSNSSHQF